MDSKEIFFHHSAGSKPGKPRILDGEKVPEVSSPPGLVMSKGQLLENYNAIINTSAIFYPVAYQFVKEAGKGRQGRVYLSMRQGARGCVTEHAIKVLDPAIYNSAEEYWTDMGRIALQISKLQRMQSPNLVSQYLYDETYGIGYIQLEAIDGLNLKEFRKKSYFDLALKKLHSKEKSKLTRNLFRIDGEKLKVQPGIVVYILRQVLRGLERLHSMNYLHCDIKPDNIMIDRLGVVKIIDFGRAVMINEKLSFLLGSTMYMAPEIHRREAPTVQSDLYSLGVLAVELLMGEPFVTNENISEEELLKIKQDLSGNLNDMLPAYVRVNKSLVDIIRKLVEFEPAKRYMSATDADVGDEGLRIIDKQLVHAGLDSEYERDLSEYLSKLVNEATQRIEHNID